MLRLTRREQVLVVGFLVVILLVSGVYMYGRPSLASQIPLPKAEEQGQVNGAASGKQETTGLKPAGEVKVDVKGAVHSPGVYSLPSGSRIADAIQVAGGANEKADLEALNLAQKLVDGGLVVVPVKGDSQSGANTVKTALSPEGKLNINTATVQQLDAVNGIGSTRAQAIVQYREQNGPFQSVDDLLKVKGFGPKLLAAIKDQLVVY
ncbi:helix-hairpin-helix domain-containing protein [Effusibacillus consociatus]|uniref:Helix-hairpin-helix domain-containing protein n=1 Tax=Effusibacillus consociatus TaxID=1117041 RepID=A0ABV9PXX7_9BACL